MGSHNKTPHTNMGRRGRGARSDTWGNKPSFNVYYSTDGGSYDSVQYCVEDIGEMPSSIMITCTCEIGGGDGTICMVGGNNYDSWHAGYMVFNAGGQLWFCVQMNANDSDGPIMSDRTWSAGDVVDICAQYDGSYARLFVDGELVAEGDRNWVPAEGGLISLKTGSHNADAPKDDGDGIVLSCQAGCYADGTLLHYGGNNDDSWMAGYILYYAASTGQFIWGIQMCANDSGPAIVVDGFPADEYSVCGTYKDGHAELWIDDELVAEQDTEWCMAEGGLLSLMTGSHQGGKDDAPEGGPMWIADVYIATQ